MPSGRFAARATESEAVISMAEFSATALRTDEDRFVAGIADAILGEVPELLRMPVEDLREVVRGDLRRALEAVSTRRLPSDDEIAASAAGVAELARQGFTIETVLHARRVSIRRARELLREAAVSRGLDADSQVEFVHRIWEWADAIQVSDAEAHRTATIELNGGGDEERRRFVRALLQGTLSPSDVTGRATAYGLLPGAAYMAFKARAAAGAETRALDRAITATGGDDSLRPLVANVGGDLVGVIARPPRISGPGIVALGFPADVSGLEASFELAGRTLETAMAFGYSGVVTIDDLSLRPAIIAEEEIGKRLMSRYLEPLHELGDFGATLEATVREYLEHGMRIDESAKALYVHPNTLRHRLDRFQQLTGADLRRTEDVLELWWALERRRLEGGPPVSSGE